MGDRVDHVTTDREYMYDSMNCAGFDVLTYVSRHSAPSVMRV
jgi:hypothetical protein